MQHAPPGITPGTAPGIANESPPIRAVYCRPEKHGRLLVLLTRNDRLTHRELAFELVVSPSTIHSWVRLLAEDGFLKIHHYPYGLEVTPRGHRWIREREIEHTPSARET